ncbi:universal stress protein [Nonomuraea sp. NPDC048916]|uniref:universal stress protein n=1 Tax=Nonomuraea sp. NPDC048916 TaxID=3154232 RepID=UPI0033CBD4B7
MIVVGVDGSRAGLEAAGWAAREAALREVPLTVAHAIPAWAVDTREGRFADVARWMREGGMTVLASGEERVRREAPKAGVETTLLPGDPRAALIKAAEGAELLVVGNHGLGGVRGMLVGSVAYGVAGHAPCDVVVVRELPPSSRAEVVVGVDGSAACERAVDFAFAEASMRGARLRAVHARIWPDVHEPGSVGGELDLLSAKLAGCRERHPGVPVIEEVVQGHPVEVLRQASEGAALLVVGSQGHGVLSGMVLGSVSNAMLQHAPCPLAIVRSGR